MPLSFPPAAGGSSVLIQAYRLLTSAEIKALFTTPIVLVAGAANKFYAVQSVLFVVRFGGTAYSNVAGKSIYIATGDQFPWATQTAAILAETADHVFMAPPFNDWALADVEGEDLLIQIDTANPTLGNGTLEVWVWYVATDV